MLKRLVKDTRSDLLAAQRRIAMQVTVKLPRYTDSEFLVFFWILVQIDTLFGDMELLYMQRLDIYSL